MINSTPLKKISSHLTQSFVSHPYLLKIQPKSRFSYKWSDWILCLSFFISLALINGCQFTSHGVSRINPHIQTTLVATTKEANTGLASPTVTSKVLPQGKTGSPSLPQSYYQNQDDGVWLKVLIYKGENFTGGNNIYFKNGSVNYGGKSYLLKDNQVTFEVKKNNPITLNGHTYFGKMLVAKKENLYVVNIVPLEEYLLGVVRKEISYSWPDEAIRAQAIVARSYGYRKYLDNYEKPYHLKGDTSDQVFAGTLNVHDNIVRGVKDTRGKILVYDNYPILTFFHASCGGMTAKASEVWPTSENLPYFQNIRCNFCTTHPRYNWEYQANISEANKKLSTKLGKKVNSFYIKKLSSSGRVSEVAVSTQNGKKIISGNDFRLALGPTELLSTKFKIKRSGGKYHVTGTGYGHGVGLCQWGAKTMAEKGYSAERILNFYYHKIRFSTIEKVDKKIRSSFAKL